ncbi:alpha/beta hydrolase [Paenibacillus sp. CMAA1739]|uniref:alpha/beta fold hydrolase n=1 Tax=Paenibacillus ottowii TaxID=2315729 RepID=UPI0027303932|nr:MULTISPECIES: alpha/beta hydrolase [Paenibacillus]MDP1513137.1 alpha/beta hydrolase [Paenibacillus ottowii]MEC4569144.1 alpha/beta hydrolase [Paenibacillus sp. CMAA1739]
MSTYQTIISDGFELKYTIRGSGKPILVIGSSIYYPRLFSNHLYKSFQFIFLDHRGFAKPIRALKPEDYTLDKVINDIEVARQCLHLDQFIILGHSGHAFMALEYAKQFPGYIEKVVLLNSAPTNSQERQRQSISYFYETASPARKERFEKEIVLLENDIKRDPDRRFVHMCIRMGAQSFYDYTYDAAYMWNNVYTNMPIIDYLWGEAFGNMDLIQSLANVRKPVLIGLGRTDYLVAPVSSWDRVNGSYTNVKKVVFEHSGHNPMFEEPHYFNQTLTEWINENH